MKTPKETNHEIKTKRYSFSLVSDTDLKKSCFLLFFINNFYNFSQFHEHFYRQLLADVPQNRCSKKFRNILN